MQAEVDHRIVKDVFPYGKIFSRVWKLCLLEGSRVFLMIENAFAS